MVPLIGEGCCGVGGASRDSAGLGAMEEGLISRGDIVKVTNHFTLTSSRGRYSWVNLSYSGELLKEEREV